MARSVIPMTLGALFLLLVICLTGCVVPGTIAEEDGENTTRVLKHATKTIQSPDGDIIDCIPITKQPAFDHPMLKNSTIQVPPMELQKLLKNHKGNVIEQGWYQTSDICPQGTVPIRRTLESSLSGVNGRYSHKDPYFPLRSNHSLLSRNDHEWATVYVDGNFHGAQGTLNIWDPTVEGENEFSLAQIWIQAGSYEKSDLNTVEAGWQVYPNKYGDAKARLFIYWTRDAYQQTGCFNVECPAFVQVSNKIVLGGTVGPVSTSTGTQYDITLLIYFKDGSWWLSYGKEVIGYWPKQIFTWLAQSANEINWGGEVVNSRQYNRHTTTQMGSGAYAQAGYKHASFLTNLKVMDLDGGLKVPHKMGTFASKAECYDIVKSSVYENTFFFGGPGFSTTCP